MKINPKPPQPQLKRTPSMDDKSVPSPPTRNHEQYMADCKAGINPIGHPLDARSVKE